MFYPLISLNAPKSAITLATKIPGAIQLSDKVTAMVSQDTKIAAIALSVMSTLGYVLTQAATATRSEGWLSFTGRLGLPAAAALTFVLFGTTLASPLPDLTNKERALFSKIQKDNGTNEDLHAALQHCLDNPPLARRLNLILKMKRNVGVDQQALQFLLSFTYTAIGLSSEKMGQLTKKMETILADIKGTQETLSRYEIGLIAHGSRLDSLFSKENKALPETLKGFSALCTQFIEKMEIGLDQSEAGCSIGILDSGVGAKMAGLPDVPATELHQYYHTTMVFHRDRKPNNGSSPSNDGIKDCNSGPQCCDCAAEELNNGAQDSRVGARRLGADQKGLYSLELEPLADELAKYRLFRVDLQALLKNPEEADLPSLKKEFADTLHQIAEGAYEANKERGIKVTNRKIVSSLFTKTAPCSDNRGDIQNGEEVSCSIYAAKQVEAAVDQMNKKHGTSLFRSPFPDNCNLGGITPRDLAKNFTAIVPNNGVFGHAARLLKD